MRSELLKLPWMGCVPEADAEGRPGGVVVKRRESVAERIGGGGE